MADCVVLFVNDHCTDSILVMSDSVDSDGVRTLPISPLKRGSKSDFFVFFSKSRWLIVSDAVNLVRR